MGAPKTHRTRHNIPRQPRSSHQLVTSNIHSSDDSSVRSNVLPTVYMDLRTCDVARVLGAKVIDGVGNFCRLTQAPEWQLLDNTVCPRRKDRSLDCARSDGVYTNSERPEVPGHLSCQRRQRSFHGA